MCGSAYNLTLSHDPGQQYGVIADGTNHRIRIRIDAIATDSLGNVHMGEVDSGSGLRNSFSKTVMACAGFVP